jgi:uncharacterized protein DUF3551
MRKLLAASTLLLAIGAPPATARDYPWCAKIPDNGGFPQCSFTTFEQCVATINGLGGDCVQNPAMGYGQGYDQGAGPRKRAARKKRYPGVQDNGWNNNGWDDRRW